MTSAMWLGLRWCFAVRVRPARRLHSWLHDRLPRRSSRTTPHLLPPSSGGKHAARERPPTTSTHCPIWHEYGTRCVAARDYFLDRPVQRSLTGLPVRWANVLLPAEHHDHGSVPDRGVDGHLAHRPALGFDCLDGLGSSAHAGGDARVQIGMSNLNTKTLRPSAVARAASLLAVLAFMSLTNPIRLPFLSISRADDGGLLL